MGTADWDYADWDYADWDDQRNWGFGGTVTVPLSVADRLHHDGMVNLDYLRPGRHVELMNTRYGSFGVNEVLEQPRSEMFMGHPVSKVRLRHTTWPAHVAVHDHYLADMGLVPYYPARSWNSVNYVLPAEVDR